MKWYGLVDNRISEQRANGEIYVGAGVTAYYYSDTRAWYVAEILKRNKKGEPTELRLIRAKVKALDYYAGKWKVFPFEDANKDNWCTVLRTRATKDGHRYWTENGTVNGTKFVIGRAEEYEDPSF